MITGHTVDKLKRQGTTGGNFHMWEMVSFLKSWTEEYVGKVSEKKKKLHKQWYTINLEIHENQCKTSSKEKTSFSINLTKDKSISHMQYK